MNIHKDIEKVQLLKELNWKPASTYWYEQNTININKYNELHKAVTDYIADQDINKLKGKI